MKARAGIFCMVNKELIFDISEIEYLGDTGYIKYPFSHHEMWDKLKPDDVIGDYDAFPRGKLIFDIAGEKYKLYADKTIEQSLIQGLVEHIDPEVYLQIYYVDNFID